MRAPTAAGKGAVSAEKQDAAIAVLDHRIYYRLGAIDGAVEHHAAHPFPIFDHELGKRLVRPDRGVVDKDVDAAKFGHRLRYHAVDLVLVGDVAKHGERLDALITNLAGDDLGFGLVAAGIDDNMRAFGGKFERGGAPDIASRPGDQRDFSFELAHPHFLPRPCSARRSAAILPSLTGLGNRRRRPGAGRLPPGRAARRPAVRRASYGAVDR